MPDFLDNFFASLIAYLSMQVLQILDLITYLAVGAFNLEINGNGMLATIDAYFPFVAAAKPVFMWTGIGLVIALFIFGIARVAMSANNDELEHPFFQVVRFFGAGFAVYTAYIICGECIKLASTVYSMMWVIDSSADASMYKFSEISTYFTAGLQTAVTDAGLVAITGPVLALVVLIFMIAIGWNYIKLIMEIAERYLLVAVFTVASPWFFASLASKNTSKIFQGFCRVYFSQFALMTMSVFFLRTFNSAMAQYSISHGAIAGTTATYGAFTAGNIISFMIALLALLIVAQRADNALQSTGMNVATTGSGLMGEAAVAFRTLQGASRGMGKAGREIAYNTSGQGSAIASGQVGTAFQSYTGQGVPNGFNLQTGMKGQNSADFTMRSPDGNPTRVQSFDKESAPDPQKAPGFWTTTDDGTQRYLVASGDNVAEALSPVKTTLPDYEDTAKSWQQDYNTGLQMKNNDPSFDAKGYADTKAYQRAADNGQAATYDKHNEEVSKSFSGFGFENMAVEPQEGRPGVMKYAGTKANGEYQAGEMYAKGFLGDNLAMPSESKTDNHGNGWRMTSDADLPEYGQGALADPNSNAANVYENVTPDMAAAYAATVSDGLQRGEDGYEAGRAQLESAGVNEAAINDMEEVYADNLSGNGSYETAAEYSDDMGQAAPFSAYASGKNEGDFGSDAEQAAPFNAYAGGDVEGDFGSNAEQATPFSAYASGENEGDFGSNAEQATPFNAYAGGDVEGNNVSNAVQTTSDNYQAASENLQSYVSAAQGNGQFEYFQNQHFPEIGNVIPGDINGLDYSRAKTDGMYQVESQAGGQKFATRMLDANRYQQEALSTEVRDGKNHSYYAETKEYGKDKNGQPVAPKFNKPRLKAVRSAKEIVSINQNALRPKRSLFPKKKR